LAFVRALEGGWLEVTCPHDGDATRFLFQDRRIDLMAPLNCGLLRVFAREASQ
jgi:hypothetical protein